MTGNRRNLYFYSSTDGLVFPTFVGEEQTVVGEPLVTSVQDCLQHGFVEQTVSHPLRDDDVYLLYRQYDLFYLS